MTTRALCAWLSMGIVALGCAGTGGRPPATPVATMHANFQAALEMRNAAVVGDFERVNEWADALTVVMRVEGGLPEGTETEQAALRSSAFRAAYTDDATEAARATAEVARRCGDCHRAAGSGLGERFVVGGMLTGESVTRHMARYAWISRLLWDGLVGPSDRTWSAGAEALVDSPGFPEEMAAVVGDRSVREGAATRLRTLGQEAVDATTPDARSRILGNIWATCAGCHVEFHPVEPSADGAGP